MRILVLGNENGYRKSLGTRGFYSYPQPNPSLSTPGSISELPPEKGKEEGWGAGTTLRPLLSSPPLPSSKSRPHLFLVVVAVSPCGRLLPPTGICRLAFRWLCSKIQHLHHHTALITSFPRCSRTTQNPLDNGTPRGATVAPSRPQGGSRRLGIAHLQAETE